MPLPKEWVSEVATWAMYHDRPPFPVSQSQVVATWERIGRQLDAVLVDKEQDCVRCPVCQYSMSRPAERSKVLRVRVSYCGHVMHLPCLLEWLRVSKRCPVCRHKVD